MTRKKLTMPDGGYVLVDTEVSEEELKNLNSKKNLTHWAKVLKESYLPKDKRDRVLKEDTVDKILTGGANLLDASRNNEYPAPEAVAINSARQHVMLENSVSSTIHVKPLEKLINKLVKLDTHIMRKVSELAFFNLEITHNNVVSSKLRNILGVELVTDRLEDKGKRWTEVVQKSHEEDAIGKRHESLMKMINDNYGDDPAMLLKIKDVVRSKERETLFHKAMKKNKFEFNKVGANFFSISLYHTHVDDKEWKKQVVAFKKEFNID
jgi:hypothetical protein